MAIAMPHRIGCVGNRRQRQCALREKLYSNHARPRRMVAAAGATNRRHQASKRTRTSVWRGTRWRLIPPLADRGRGLANRTTSSATGGSARIHLATRNASALIISDMVPPDVVPLTLCRESSSPQRISSTLAALPRLALQPNSKRWPARDGCQGAQEPAMPALSQLAVPARQLRTAQFSSIIRK
jgi:hypothetical protein